MNRILLILLLLSNAAIAQVDLTLGLRAYYPFNGNANDASGNNNNPVFNNATLTSDRQGSPNNAYHFDGATTYMKILNSPSLNMTNNISVAAWVKPMGFYSGTCHNNMLFMKGDADYLTGNYSLRYTPDPLSGCVSSPPLSQSVFYGVNGIATTPFVQLNRWYSVVWTSDGINAKIYVDCELKNTVPAGSFSFTNTFDLYFGKMNNSTYPFWLNGDLDEVRIYDRALNADEVKAYGDCSSLTTGTNIGGIINTYTPVLALNPCNNKITVEDASTFNIGDTVLMIQMKGAVIDSTNTAAFGTITDYKNAGNYEINYVKSKAGNIIELKNILTRQYDIPGGKVQLVRVPYYQNVNITSTLTCLPWDGSKGGILVLNVQDTINLTANIDVSGKGFKGGIGFNSQAAALNCFQNNYYYPQSSNADAGQKGESIYTISPNRNYGKGNTASGGGGGLGHNSGGGGGANGGTGGFGGYQLDNCGSSPFDNRGIGGKAMLYNTATNKIFLGGGGGAGQADNPGNVPPFGGDGGGITIMLSAYLKTNGNKILSNGNNASVCSIPASPDCHDGMGGGGAGGSILLSINQFLDNTSAENKGGKGADMVGSVALGGRIGGGGGGSGGLLFLKNASLPGNVINVNTGGLNGVLTQDGNSSWGATPGQTGAALFDLVVPIDNVLFKPNIDSTRFNFAATGCSSFDFQGFGYTNTSPVASWQWYFGDGGTATIQNTSHTYLSSGIFTVKLVITDINGCRDSITRDVTTNAISSAIIFKYLACNPHTTIALGGSGGSSVQHTWDFGDATSVSGAGLVTVLHTYPNPGIYTIKHTVTSGGCSDSSIMIFDPSVIQDNIVLTNDTTICYGTTKQLIGISSGSLCWSPSTYLTDPLISNPVTSTPSSITYYYTAETAGTNLLTNGDFSLGNNGFSSDYTFQATNTGQVASYGITTNAQSWYAAASPCTGHTGTGNMFVANGATTAGMKVWKATVPVTPATNYQFSAWMQSVSPGNATNTSGLRIYINNKVTTYGINTNVTNCQWIQDRVNWNSGNSTSVEIALVNETLSDIANDFALDDIFFGPVYLKKDSVRITVDTPHVQAVSDPSICEGTSVQLSATGATTYSWTPATGLSNPNIANPMASPTSTTNYTVTGINASGCSATDNVTVNVSPKPIITITNDTAICRNTSVQLNASGGGIYTWLPAATLNNASIANPVATPAASTMYYVTVTNAANCTNLDSVKVDIVSIAQFGINGNNNTCLNTPVQLNAFGGNIYSWQPQASLNNPGIANPVATPLVSTTYSVTITETTCNESATLTTRVNILPLPVLNATKSNDIDCKQNQSQLNVSGAIQYSWSPAGTLNNAGISSPVATPSATTQYTVLGTDASGCTNTDTITVNVTNANYGGYLMPTAFTPNNDGLNDCYGIKYWGTITNLEFSIYNRWGERIFFTNNPSGCWDGKINGIPQNPAVFVYMIKASTTCEPLIFRKGTFALIR